MVAVPLKSEYRPTLGQLLAPRWRRSSRMLRALAVLAGALILAVLVGGVLTLESPHFSHGGAVPFSFSYKGLDRTRPEAGAYVEVQHLRGGLLEDSFAVRPLTLPPYRGQPSGALALYAVGYIHRLAERLPGFELRGEGVTQNDSLAHYTTYNVFYTTKVRGRNFFGRDVLVLTQRPGVRRGVDIAMLTSAESSDRQIVSPLSVGTVGVLERPLGTFTLG
jgi:hypothetical protein